ncbi:MAG: dockerin type 1, partial [Chloroflexota bacterium]
AIVMTGGVVLVSGPTEQMNGALDYDGGFAISGGTLAAAGSSGMAQAPGSSSTQNSVIMFFSSTVPAESEVALINSAGETILAFAPDKPYQSVVMSSPDLVMGETYDVTIDGSVIGNFTVNSVVTQVGSGR